MLRIRTSLRSARPDPGRASVRHGRVADYDGESVTRGWWLISRRDGTAAGRGHGAGAPASAGWRQAVRGRRPEGDRPAAAGRYAGRRAGPSGPPAGGGRYDVGRMAPAAPQSVIALGCLQFCQFPVDQSSLRFRGRLLRLSREVLHDPVEPAIDSLNARVFTAGGSNDG